MGEAMGGRGVAALVVATALVMGCGQSGQDDGPTEVDDETTGLAVAVEYISDGDVAGFEYKIRECRGGAVVAKEVRALEELSLPDGISAFVEQPFDGGSSHDFADFFVMLEEGCYSVEVQPVTAGGEASGVCGAAQASEVFVAGGRTTEVVLISQCQGPERGAVDVVAALNNPPEIESINYSPSKFTFECEKVEICIEAHDADGDPLAFELEQIDGRPMRLGPKITGVKRQGDRVTTCFEVVPVFNGTAHFRARVYDLLWSDGKPMRAADLLGVASHAEMVIPLHTNWDFELECYDQEEDEFHRFNGVREIHRDPQCLPIWPEQFFCSEMYWHDTATSCPDGEFRPETIYPLCEDHQGEFQVQ